MRGLVPHRVVVAVSAALVTALGAAACGSSSAPGADAISWADRVCGTLGTFTSTVSAPPALDASDPVATVTALRDYLGRSAVGIDQALKGLDGVGPSPVADGDAYVVNLRATLRGVREGFASASDGLATLDIGNPAAVMGSLPAVLAPLQDIGKLADPAQGLESSDDLRAATEQAPQCRVLRGS